MKSNLEQLNRSQAGAVQLLSDLSYVRRTIRVFLYPPKLENRK